jgi:hypothetical protein
VTATATHLVGTAATLAICVTLAAGVVGNGDNTTNLRLNRP